MEQTAIYKESIFNTLEALASFPTLKDLWQGYAQRLEAKMTTAVEVTKMFLEIIPQLKSEEIDQLLKEFSKVKPILAFFGNLEYEPETGPAFAQRSAEFLDLFNQIIYKLEAYQEHYVLKADLAYRRKLRRQKLADRL